MTSYLVKREGNKVTTINGSEYTLEGEGDVCSEYMEHTYGLSTQDEILDFIIKRNLDEHS